MSEDNKAGPMELGPGIEVMRAIASVCWHVCPPYYNAVKFVAYRIHHRYRAAVNDEPGVKWEDSKHKKALDRVYKY